MNRTMCMNPEAPQYLGGRMNAEECMSMVRSVMDGMDLAHWDVEGQSIIAARASGDTEKPDIIISFEDDSIAIYSYVEDLDDQENNLEMYKFINLLNQQMGGGHAALADNHRDVFFSNIIEMKDIGRLTEEMIKRNLARALYNLAHFGLGIVAVASGYMDANSALEGLTSDVAN